MSEPSPTAHAMKAFFPRQLRQWLGPLAVVALLAATAAVLVMTTGVLAFPASQEDPEGLARIVHAAFKNSAHEHSRDVQVPADVDASWRVQLGAAHFARVCASCHGEPGRGQSPIALSMRPRPQYLANVVRNFDERELFWIVQNGVKFAGMPAWPHPQREDEIWSLVAFLKQIDTMPAPQYVDQAYGDRAGANADEGAGAKASQEKSPGSGRAAFSVKDAGEPPAQEFSYTWPAVGFRTPTYDLGGAKGCVACHGAQGNGRPEGMAPNLTLQSPEYLHKALQSFASGDRPSGIMQSVATALTEEDMRQLARDYGARAVPTAGAQAAAADALGASIAERGVPDRKVPACINCHGTTGAYQVAAALPGVYPRLDGQNRDYLAQQLRLFRADERGGRDVSDPMSDIAHDLTDEEIAALSAHYASRAPTAIAKTAP